MFSFFSREQCTYGPAYCLWLDICIHSKSNRVCTFFNFFFIWPYSCVGHGLILRMYKDTTQDTLCHVTWTINIYSPVQHDTQSPGDSLSPYKWASVLASDTITNKKMHGIFQCANVWPVTVVYPYRVKHFEPECWTVYTQECTQATGQTNASKCSISLLCGW